MVEECGEESVGFWASLRMLMCVGLWMGAE